MTPPTDSYEIEDLSSLHHYRTELPNILCKMKLTPHEMATYVVLKMTAGDRGVCFKSSATLCEEIGYGKMKLIETKLSLAKKGLIKITKRKHENGGDLPDLIQIVDIWEYNMLEMPKYFKKNKKQPANGGGLQNGGGGVCKMEGGGLQNGHKQEPLQQEKKEQQQQSPAAAVFRKPKEEAKKPESKTPPKPRISPALANIDIPEREKIEITGMYEESIIRNAVEWATHPETVLTKGLVPAIKWGCKNKPEVPKTKTVKKVAVDCASFNRAYWRAISKALCFSGFRSVWADMAECNEYLKAKTEKIFFKDFSFLEQISCHLRKIGVDNVEIFNTIKSFQKDLESQCR